MKLHAALPLALLFVATGCAPAPAPAGNNAANDHGPAAADRLALTEADNDRRIELAVGETLSITLRANQTTPYRWQVAASPAFLRAEGDDYEADAQTAGPPRVGAGGHITFRFTATRAGEGALRLEHRPITGGGRAAETFQVTVAAR